MNDFTGTDDGTVTCSDLHDLLVNMDWSQIELRAMAHMDIETDGVGTVTGRHRDYEGGGK